MNTKISAIILTKDEENNLEECIKRIKPNVDETIIIDSSDKKLDYLISAEHNCRYYHKNFDNVYKGFSDLRNFGNAIAKNDWCLHIDVDEVFSDTFFKNINEILEIKSNAYAFPRINLPFYEMYPDYQVRLINRLNTEWTNNIHEAINIFAEPVEIIYLDNYPIIHKHSSKQHKLQANKRWNNFNHRNILICSLFKNSEPYIDIFLKCLQKLFQYNTKNQKYTLDICFIEGNSTDTTYEKLKTFTAQNKNIKCKLKQIHLPNSIDRFTSLSILRNLLIKFGLKNYHDYVLMIDSDIIFKEDLLYQLIKSVETNQCDAIAPLPFIEDYNEYENDYFYDTLAFIDNNNNNFKHTYPYTAETETQKDIIKMTSIGTCYLIKSNIYNINDFSNFNIIKCYNENKLLTTYESLEDNVPISEQVAFFKKMKGIYQIYVDTNIKILHVNLQKLGLKWH